MKSLSSSLDQRSHAGDSSLRNKIASPQLASIVSFQPYLPQVPRSPALPKERPVGGGNGLVEDPMSQQVVG